MIDTEGNDYHIGILDDLFDYQQRNQQLLLE